MGVGNQEEKRLELKVGVLIFVALGLLVAFLLIVSDVNFGERKEMEIYFQNPGGLSPGVSVKVAGRKVGKVTEMTFVGQQGPVNPVTGRPSLIRVRMEVDSDVYSSLREDVHFYVTSKGPLGDPFLEMDPGVSDNPVDPEKDLFGTDPPRLDLFLADAAELVRSLNRLLVTNQEDINKLITGSSSLVTTVNEYVNSEEASNGETKARFTRILENVEQLTVDTQVLVHDVNEKYVNNPAVEKTLKNMQSITTKLNRELDPLLADVRQTMATLDRVGNTIGPEEQEAIRQSLAKLKTIASRADNTIARVDKMVARIEKGQGTVGQLMQDEEIYDDLKELLRDIKHHPWKLIWED